VEVDWEVVESAASSAEAAERETAAAKETVEAFEVSAAEVDLPLIAGPTYSSR